MKEKIVVNLTPRQVNQALAEFVGKTRRLPEGWASNWNTYFYIGKKTPLQVHFEFDFEEGATAPEAP